MLRIACILLTLVASGVPAFSADGYIPSHPGIRVLFQGDSITDGGRGRSADPNHIYGQSYVFLIASDYGVGYPDRQLAFISRGVSGNKVTDLMARWKDDTIELHPDVLSILVGINDFNQGVPAEKFEGDLEALLTSTKQTLPSVKLVLCEPFALPVGRYKDDWDQVLPKLRVRQESIARLGSKYGAVVVHYQKVFDDAASKAAPDFWIWDGIHPTYAGHRLMADEWKRAVDAGLR